MLEHELEALLRNMGDDQIAVIAGIAVRLATASSERFTGKISFETNMNQGVVGDMHVNRTEIVRISKIRGVRSKGV